MKKVDTDLGEEGARNGAEFAGPHVRDEHVVPGAQAKGAAAHAGRPTALGDEARVAHPQVEVIALVDGQRHAAPVGLRGQREERGHPGGGALEAHPEGHLVFLLERPVPERELDASAWGRRRVRSSPEAEKRRRRRHVRQLAQHPRPGGPLAAGPGGGGGAAGGPGEVRQGVSAALGGLGQSRAGERRERAEEHAAEAPRTAHSRPLVAAAAAAVVVAAVAVTAVVVVRGEQKQVCF